MRFSAPSLTGILTCKQTGRVANTLRIHTYFLLHANCWSRSKLPTPWGSNRFPWNIIDWQFCHLSYFLTNGISLRSGEAEMKNLQRAGQAHFLRPTSPDSSLKDRSGFEFALCHSRVCSQMWACSHAITLSTEMSIGCQLRFRWSIDFIYQWRVLMDTQTMLHPLVHMILTIFTFG